MSSLKTIVRAWALCLLAPAALTAAPGDLTRQFATCTGRLSAQMEFQWLLSDAGSDRTEEERAAMISLLEAVVRPEDRRNALALRIEAKQAHTALLTRAHFNDDKAQATWAANRAAVEIGRCRSLILG
jgi:hypothetical protein